MSHFSRHRSSSYGIHSIGGSLAPAPLSYDGGTVDCRSQQVRPLLLAGFFVSLLPCDRPSQAIICGALNRALLADDDSEEEEDHDAQDPHEPVNI